MDVTEGHPEVEGLVMEALKEAERDASSPRLDIYGEILTEHIKEVSEPGRPSLRKGPKVRMGRGVGWQLHFLTGD